MVKPTVHDRVELVVMGVPVEVLHCAYGVEVIWRGLGCWPGESRPPAVMNGFPTVTTPGELRALADAIERFPLPVARVAGVR